MTNHQPSESKVNSTIGCPCCGEDYHNAEGCETWEWISDDQLSQDFTCNRCGTEFKVILVPATAVLEKPGKSGTPYQREK